MCVLFTFIQSLLTCRFQTELATDAHVTVPDVTNTHAIASDAHRDNSNTDAVPGVRHDAEVGHDVADTLPIVSEVRNDVVNTRNTMKTREDKDGQRRAVSITHTLLVTE